jgi:branched-chain amino acid transport system permease protein
VLSAAIAGGLYSFFLGSIEPGFLSIDQSLAIVAMVLLGGRGAVAAPFIGALVLTTLPHVIHLGAELRTIVYGSILIFTILVMPQGIYGSIAALTRRPPHAI